MRDGIANDSDKTMAIIELTTELGQQLQEAGGDPLDVTDPGSGQRYVILRAEVYDRLKRLLQCDNDLTSSEQLQLLADSGRRAGWNDPSMDVYDDYDTNRQKACQ